MSHSPSHLLSATRFVGALRPRPAAAILSQHLALTVEGWISCGAPRAFPLGRVAA